MIGSVRTVRGDAPPERLGRTNYHEHLFQVSPLLEGDELDNEKHSGEEAATLHEAGMDAMVEATPTGLGRDPLAMARVSARSGLKIIATTGAHREQHYGEGHWLLKMGAEELCNRFVRDLTEALPASEDHAAAAPAITSGGPVRAGILKAGVGYWSITRFELRVLEAIAEAHTRTGAPVMVHLEHGSAAFEVLGILTGLGVSAQRIVLAHADRNPDPGMHVELAAAGTYLGYDSGARLKDRPDSTVIACILETAALGAADRLLLGSDFARRSRYAAYYGGMPGLAYLPSRFVPRLAREGGQDLIDAMLVRNPARLLTWAT